MADFMKSELPWQNWAAGQVKYLIQPEIKGRGIEAGVWKGTQADVPAGSLVKYKRNELIYIISGNLRLEIEGGETRELEPGDAASFAIGDRVRWTLLSEELEEFYVYIP